MCAFRTPDALSGRALRAPDDFSRRVLSLLAPAGLPGVAREPNCGEQVDGRPGVSHTPTCNKFFHYSCNWTYFPEVLITQDLRLT